jgi:hypothetical protein
MKQNIGSIDRFVRIAIGIALPVVGLGGSGAAADRNRRHLPAVLDAGAEHLPDG